MRAATLNGPEDLQIVDRPKPEPAEGEVLVKVEYCGICGSDLHAYKSGLFPFGMAIGHEYAGIIEAVGPGVEELERGQKVTGTASLACRSCFSCRSGRDNICEAMNVIGVTREGAMAEYLLVPRESIVVIKKETSLELGALAEPYSVALHAAEMIGVNPEQTVVILGAGTIGLCLLAELKRRGLEKIFVVDMNEERLSIAGEMGADVLINPAKESVDKRIGELTSGACADLVFECVGSSETIREATNLVRQGGTVLVLGICEIPVELFFLGLVTREIQIRTSYGATAAEFRQAMDIIASNPSAVKSLVGKVVALESLAEDGFAPLLDPGCSDVKILVKMN